VDVRLVQLFTAVTDPRGKPLLDLPRNSFRVFENGVEQELHRFETLSSLPIRVALLMDVSSSMRGRVHIAAKSARRFFSTVLTEKDSASLLTFNHDIRVRVPFSSDRRLLQFGASGLRAHGTTRLNDALVYAASSFAGLDGKRALILLSDGEDLDSDFDFARVLEIFLRARLAVYPILLDVTAEETREQLRHLAEVSGGRLFTVADAGGLDRVYDSIEKDLRSQYLLTYQPPQPKSGDTFRQVRVEVLKEGARARSSSGYYP
jgi:VWFA-related protein